MINYTKAFGSFSTNDLEATREFYENVLGMTVTNDFMGMPTIQFTDGSSMAFYPKQDHQPANFTILNLYVSDLEGAVDHLIANGISMERYDGYPHDVKGIARAEGRPGAAWFKDPGGNVICMLEGS